jgi:hypothetical protein
MDSRAALARQYQRDAHKAVEAAMQARAARNHLIRQLRREDPARWTHSALADAVGCSPELIAFVIRTGLDS